MDWLDLLWHLLGFVLPAAVLAPAMVLSARLLSRGRRPALGWLWQLALQLAVGVTVQVLGLVLSGHDGRMLTYAALVLASATCQAWLMRA